jgi:hypothetical protein
MASAGSVDPNINDYIYGNSPEDIYTLPHPVKRRKQAAIESC